MKKKSKKKLVLPTKARLRGRGILVRLKEDDPRFKLKEGDVLRVERYWLDPCKYTVLERVGDGFDPCCNVYASQVERL